jgi:hypothetical protein
MTPAHRAVENGDLPRLRELLDNGVDVEEIDGGVTLLQHAVDVELDGHTQTGARLHADVTAYLLARGADPLASSVARGPGPPTRARLRKKQIMNQDRPERTEPVDAMGHAEGRPDRSPTTTGRPQRLGSLGSGAHRPRRNPG